MRIVVLTSNAVRHKYVANSLCDHADQAMVVSECKPNDVAIVNAAQSSAGPIEEHFRRRYQTELDFFPGNDSFRANTLPLVHGELNLPCTYQVIREFDPEMAFVFGSSIIREPLLGCLPEGRFVNLHLGLSPYYRGSGTNFWPFVNDELQYVGATLLHIDSGIDTGDIIAHTRPTFEARDDVHSIGCKVVQSAVTCLIDLIDVVRSGKTLNRVKQWKTPHARYYRKRDFGEDALRRYTEQLDGNLIEKYIQRPEEKVRLIGSPT